MLQDLTQPYFIALIDFGTQDGESVEDMNSALLFEVLNKFSCEVVPVDC